MKASWLKRREERRSRSGGDTSKIRRRRYRYLSGGDAIAINLAPMIDVTFLLLIFFLVTTTFERAEGILESRLPQTHTRATVSLPISPIVIRITQAGEDASDYTIRVDRFDHAPQKFAELSGFLVQLQQQSGFDRDTPIVIVAGNDVRWDHVVSCWNAALRAECNNIAFAEP